MTIEVINKKRDALRTSWAKKNKSKGVHNYRQGKQKEYKASYVRDLEDRLIKA